MAMERAKVVLVLINLSLPNNETRLKVKHDSLQNYSTWLFNLFFSTPPFKNFTGESSSLSFTAST